jgi:hypothetical protein
MHITYAMTGRNDTGERVQDVWRLADFLLGQNIALEDRKSHGIETFKAHRLLSRAAEWLHETGLKRYTSTARGSVLKLTG